MYVMCGPWWLSGHVVQCREMEEPAAAVALKGAGADPLLR